MNVTRRQLNEIISNLLEAPESETKVKRSDEISATGASADLSSYVADISGAALVSLVLVLGKAIATGKITEASKIVVLEKFFKAIGGLGPLKAAAGAAGLWLITLYGVWAAFTTLPNMMQNRINQLKTVEGMLLNMRKLKDAPLNPKDITTKSSDSETIIGVSFTRQKVIDYLASAIEYSDDGKGLYSKLIKGSHKNLDGYTVSGPVIDQDFAIAIQKRRKTIKEESGDNLKDKLVSSIKELTPKESKTLMDLFTEYRNA